MVYVRCLTYGIWTSRINQKSLLEDFNAKGGIREITVKNSKVENDKKSLSKKVKFFIFT